MNEQNRCLRAYAVGDENVIDGSVENYDFDWGEPVSTPCARNCVRCRLVCGCSSWCEGQDACGEPLPEPEPDPAEEPCGCSGRCRGTAAVKKMQYPIVDL